MPLTISRLSASSDGADVRLRLHERLTTVGRFGLRRHDIDRCQRADLHPGLIVLHQLAGEIERVLRRFHRLDRVDQIPVRVPARCACVPMLVDCSVISSFCWLMRLVSSAARVAIDPEAAQQRLDDGCRSGPDWNCGLRRLIDAWLFNRLFVQAIE